MAAKSKFTTTKQFRRSLKTLGRGIGTAADIAVEEAILLAELEAQEAKRWADAGTNFFKDSGKRGPGIKDKSPTLWEWDVTGLTKESIKGYALSSRKRPKFPSIKYSNTTVRIDGVPTYFHTHETETPPIPSIPQDTVLGVMTMYSSYSKWLQVKERRGTQEGAGFPMSGGENVTIEVLKRRWASFFVPQVLKPRLKAEMAKVIGSL